MRPLPLIALTFFALAAVTPGHAGEKPKERTDASFRFLKFSELPALCAKDVRGKYAPLEVYTGFIGKPVRLSVKEPVALVPADATGAPVRRGDKTADPLGTFSALPGEPRQLVVLFGDDKKVIANVVPDCPARFPFGRVLAVNLSHTPLLMEVGGVVNRLPATGAFVCREPSRFVGDANTAVRITTADAARTKLYSTVWPFSIRVRTMAFIYKNEEGRILVRAVTDANVPELAEAPGDTGVGATKK